MAPQVLDNLERQVRSLLEQGRKLEAVKLYKELADSSLMEAKAAVEALGQGKKLPSLVRPQVGEAEIVRLLGRGEKLKAVKLYKQQTGLTLVEAKAAVEAIATRHGIPVSQGVGCAGVSLLVVVLVLFAIVVYVVMNPGS